MRIRSLAFIILLLVFLSLGMGYVVHDSVSIQASAYHNPPFAPSIASRPELVDDWLASVETNAISVEDLQAVDNWYRNLVNRRSRKYEQFSDDLDNDGLVDIAWYVHVDDPFFGSVNAMRTKYRNEAGLDVWFYRVVFVFERHYLDEGVLEEIATLSFVGPKEEILHTFHIQKIGDQPVSMQYCAPETPCEDYVVQGSYPPLLLQEAVKWVDELDRAYWDHPGESTRVPCPTDSDPDCYVERYVAAQGPYFGTIEATWERNTLSAMTFLVDFIVDMHETVDGSLAVEYWLHPAVNQPDIGLLYEEGSSEPTCQYLRDYANRTWIPDLNCPPLDASYFITDLFQFDYPFNFAPPGTHVLPPWLY